MARKKYVALATVDYRNNAGERVFARPNDKKTKGVFTADYTEAQEQRLIDRRAIRVATKKDLAPDTAAEDEDVGQLPPGDGLPDMTVSQLKTLAEDETIDLGEAKTKAEIVKAIRAARLAKPGSGENDLLA